MVVLDGGGEWDAGARCHARSRAAPDWTTAIELDDGRRVFA